MSDITNIILHVGGLEDENKIDEVNTFFEAVKVPGLVSINAAILPDRWYGGTKYFEDGVYLGAYNYLDLDAFIQHLKTISWHMPQHIQVFAEQQEDWELRAINII